MTIPEQAVKEAHETAAQLEERTKLKYVFGDYHLVPLALIYNAVTAIRALAALTEAAPHMSGVKVKQLEWREKDNDAYAHSDVGYYEINETRLGFCVYRNTFLVSKDMFETLESAKAAAQADYEKRILSAIEPFSAREQALDLSVLERMAEKAGEFDAPDELGPYPNIQDAMVTVGDLRKLRKLLAAIRALKSQPAPQTGDEDE